MEQNKYYWNPTHNGTIAFFKGFPQRCGDVNTPQEILEYFHKDPNRKGLVLLNEDIKDVVKTIPVVKVVGKVEHPIEEVNAAAEREESTGDIAAKVRELYGDGFNEDGTKKSLNKIAKDLGISWATAKKYIA